MNESLFFAVHNCVEKNYLTSQEEKKLNSVIDVPHWNNTHEVKIYSFRQADYENAKKKFL